ncbi:D-ribose transport binding protein [Nosema bombycis CQ1]|uniref:D-ribose transport binding protein n=1 Tax=Nosema bombycis (strain CQ1 / CVCC 102059) TaxID=578461 RepID=R0M339_NOSB1|nr:D-ribose transport binding protein [Nosema bombycis CQ1]|eukprot:EOB12414.1 D-ribose transport binding protein [Nosema bombycis CQ1]
MWMLVVIIFMRLCKYFLLLCVYANIFYFYAFFVEHFLEIPFFSFFITPFLLPPYMYQNILNFLFGKTRKSLSKKEADDLIRLIAQSIGLEEEYKDKTDDKSFIKKILDEVVIEENDFNLDEIFDFEEDSYEYPEDYEDQEEFERGKPLSKRKIKRKSVFKKGDDGKGRDVGDMNMEDGDKDKEDVNAEVEMNQPSLPPIDEPSQNTFKLLSSSSQSTFSLPPSQPTFKLPPSQPSFKIEDNDFPFDLGQLDSVKNTGPFYKFLDENGEDL